MTSHQRQPLMQPITLTGVPGRSQVTSGNARSGPARMLTACVVNADCAKAEAGNNRHSASRLRFRIVRGIAISIASN